MRTPRVVPLLALLLLSSTIPGCSSPCGDAFMNTQTAGRVYDPTGAQIADGVLYLSRGEGGTGTLRAWLVGEYALHGAPLRGHLTRAHVVGPSGEELLEMPLTDPTNGSELMISFASRSIPDDATYAALRAALVSERTAIVVDTDLPGLEHLVVRQRLGNDRPMGPVYCD